MAAVRPPAHVCRGQIHWVMHTRVCVCAWGVTVELWSPAETQTQKRGHKKHFYFTWPVISSKYSACGLQTERVFSLSVKSIWRFTRLKRESELGAGFQEHRIILSLGEDTRIQVRVSHFFVCILNIHTWHMIKCKTYKQNCFKKGHFPI